MACTAGSPQVSWLQADLAANPRECVAAPRHEPRFSSGPHGDQTDMAALRSALDAAGVELVLAGHDHDYERLLPTDPSGTLDTAHGVMSLVVGTGGVGEVTGFTPRPNSAVREAATFGVKKLTLRAHDFDWPFIPVAGKTFTDPGTASCHAAP